MFQIFLKMNSVYRLKYLSFEINVSKKKKRNIYQLRMPVNATKILNIMTEMVVWLRLYITGNKIHSYQETKWGKFTLWTNYVRVIELLFPTSSSQNSIKYLIIFWKTSMYSSQPWIWTSCRQFNVWQTHKKDYAWWTSALLAHPNCM